MSNVIEEYNGHPEVKIWLPNWAKYISVDEQLASMMILLDKRWIQTFYSCQGQDISDPNDPVDIRLSRAYVLMHHDNKTEDLINDMIDGFDALNLGNTSLTKWTFEFDRYPEHGRRVAIRFPHNQIESFTNFLIRS